TGEKFMSDTTLTNDQAAALVKRLGSDDAFRELFESKPAMALRSIGVDAETIVNLNPACLTPAKLADKSAFVSASGQLNESVVASAMAMNTPKLNLRN
ncbi:MAG: NHLP-related RiPP peptide, partial [Dokdonella sp.]